jgi:hypothetical protein
VANVVISNVPGPPMPLYMAGARMLTNYPTSIIVHGMALNITVQSYDRSLDFGLMADAQAMPDVHDLAQALRVAMDDLRALPRPGEPDPEAPALEGVVSRATRKLAGGISEAITGAVNSVARTAVGVAVESAVSRVTGLQLRVSPGRAPQPSGDARAENGRVRVVAGGIGIEVDDRGLPDGEPLLLIMGLGMQLTGWPDELVQMLVTPGLSRAALRQPRHRAEPVLRPSGRAQPALGRRCATRWACRCARPTAWPTWRPTRWACWTRWASRRPMCAAPAWAA